MEKQMMSDVDLVYRRKNHTPAVTIRMSGDAVQPIKDTYPEGTIGHREFFGMLMLNRANVVIHKCLVSMGGMNTVVVDPKVVMQFALLSNAAGIILFHNHPSNVLRPSQHDLQLTKRICEACTIMDIALHDHIIVTDSDLYFSFADEGML